ncbi:MAG: hypothetical protein ABS23_04360 [SAR92 bacterium BACL16 MAG-120619-bin48]|nr:MAG: hypothetical protein ABS23_04360 [SAR92 bacterium BACL16 MAG-120619-bin48]
MVVETTGCRGRTFTWRAAIFVIGLSLVTITPALGGLNMRAGFKPVIQRIMSADNIKISR